ncbi:zinc finger protein 512 isoform X3 [Arapaima gigas]
MDRKSQNVSASKTSWKRKASRPRPKRKAQDSCKPPEKKSKAGIDRLNECEKAEPRRPQKIKRTYERRPSQHLCVVVPTGDSASETSCCSLTDGGESRAPCARRLHTGTEAKTGVVTSETSQGTGAVVKGRRKQRCGCKATDENAAKESEASVPASGHNEKNLKEDYVHEQKAKSNEESPCYSPGSQEELWNLQILGKGRATCPKCKTVSRKTVEGLKKHMINCKLNPFTCQHCGKQLKSLTGMKYHVMADHNNLPTSMDVGEDDSQAMKEKLRKVLKRMGKLKCTKQSPEKDEDIKDKIPPKEVDPERTPSGRVKRISAQVAIFHLQEIASEELLKEWPKRKVQQDLVPDDKKLKYARPGLPAFSQEILRKWKNEVKLQRKVQCPNQGCKSVYTSVSGLKAHLGLCAWGDFEVGKYKCLICDKEFSSESGVKYHINSIHAQDWFIVTSKASKSFAKLLKTKSKENCVKPRAKCKPTLKFSLEPKGWQDRRPSKSPAPGLRAKPGRVNVECKLKEVPSSKEKDCYDFSGSDSHSSSSSSDSSSSESEADEPEAPKQDKWALKRPVARADAARQAKGT